ncbi:T9SS type A sorting domain-containing protein [Candidatus Poribacteria bacterium]|nr:T9SS type A sorting domain-containing protein [Candidatus Poribacteria bacterium]
MTLTVHNPRTGRVETMAYTEMPGTLHAVWADLSRRSVVEADDVLEIQVRDGARLVGVMRHAITPDEVTRAFAQLRLTPQDLLPTKTLLLANYPNPFNPETWVPYQLAKDTNVSIRIYDSAGRSVRTLNLGYKAAGYYLDKSRAAYWDGRNDVGERMASGVYFYQLVTKDASATRKLVIMK